MENIRIPKIVLNAELDGEGIVGRPKLRWLDDDQADLRIRGIKGWRWKEQERSEWMNVSREAEVKLRGL
jgi:hypothetical protein